MKREPFKIGFRLEPFPVDTETISEQREYTLPCRMKFMVNVSVSQCKLLMDMGKGNEPVRFSGIVTSEVSISEKLPLGGFNSHCHIDEAETMLVAAEKYCDEEGLVLGNVYCNWPMLRADVRRK